MTKEDEIKSKLTGKFLSMEAATRVQRQRRVFTSIEYSKFREVMGFVLKDLGFKMLSTITGLDEGDNLSFIYHFSREDGIMLNIKTSVPKSDPRIKTITDVFPNADIYERELVDLFGAKVEGLTEGNRYPLTDDWPKGQYPLRKDWKAPLEEEGCDA